MTALALLHTTLLLAMLTAAAVVDLRERRVPNGLTAGGILAGVILGAVAVGGVPSSALLGVGLALVVGFPLFALGALGAGDVKLMMAVGAFLGVPGVVDAALYAGVAGGLLSAVASLRAGTLVPALLGARSAAAHVLTGGRRGHPPATSGEGLPYAVAIAAGTVVALLAPILG